MSKYINSLCKSNQVYKNGKFEYLLKGYYSFFSPYFFPFFSDEHGIVLIYSIPLLFILFTYQYFSVFACGILINACLSLFDCFFLIIEEVSFFKHVLNVIKWSSGRFYLNIHNASCILRCTILLLHFNVSEREIHTN